MPLAPDLTWQRLVRHLAQQRIGHLVALVLTLVEEAGSHQVPEGGPGLCQSQRRDLIFHGDVAEHRHPLDGALLVGRQGVEAGREDRLEGGWQRRRFASIGADHGGARVPARGVAMAQHADLAVGIEVVERDELARDLMRDRR